MRGIESPEKRVKVVAGVRLMRLTLLQDVNAFSSKNKVDSREALRRITLGLVCVHDFPQRSNQTVGTVLMLEPLEGERLFCTAVNAHHPLYEHLTQIVEHAGELYPKERHRQRIPLVRFHFFHAGSVQAPRLRGKLANLANRQLVQRSNGRLLRNKRSMMID